MAKIKLLSVGEFNALIPTLHQRLADALNKELADCALPDLGADPNSDLWDLPTVDSKTVAKLSPTVKELIGRRLDPTWIRKGGYSSVADAVSDLLAKIREHCVAQTTVDTRLRKVAAAVTP